jgi:hypothetical protein
MRVSTLLLLSRPSSRTDRARLRLVAAAVAVDGALLLGCERIARVRGEPSVAESGLASFMVDSFNRGVTSVGALLLSIPVGALFLQSIRVGTSTRSRGLAALRLAGATPREVRRVAGAEMARASLIGGALAGPTYLGLWVALGVLAPAGSRVMPSPDPVDLGAWLLVMVFSAAGGGLAGAWVHRQVIVDPLTARHRLPPRISARRSVVKLAACATTFAAAWELDTGEFFSQFWTELWDLVLTGVLGISLLAAAFVTGPWMVRLVARWLRARDGAAAVLAGARLAAEPRAPGRAVAVLLICGLVLWYDGFVLLGSTGWLGGSPDDDLGPMIIGTGLVAAGTLVAAVVAVVTLIVGAVDQLLDAQRPLACLAALGAERQVLAHVMRQQLVAASAPAAVLSPWIVFPLAAVTSSGSLVDSSWLTQAAPAATCTSVGFGAFTVFTASLAARALRPQLRAAMDPENLRTP